MKLLLYCTKAKPMLRDYRGKAIYNRFVISPTDRPFTSDDKQPILNGKIVAECDFEVEGIKWNTTNWVDNFLTTKSMSEEELKKRSCVNGRDLREYFEICYDSISDSVVGYAIHIKNLHIFDKSKYIQDYSKNENPYNYIENAPQNMMYAYDVKSFNNFEKKVLISIRPEWLCKILNGEKIIEIRKKVLKEML